MTEVKPKEVEVENPPKTGQTQYKATRIWYEIINSFHESVPLKKHWRNFRTYQDCFSASEAIDWLYRYLKASPNFKSHTSLTRQQAIQLLQIFLKEKIIEDVRAGDVKFTFKEFTDDDRLYKFCTNNRFYKNVTKSDVSKTEPTSKTTKETSEVNDLKPESKKSTEPIKTEAKPAPNKENLDPSTSTVTTKKSSEDSLLKTKILEMPKPEFVAQHHEPKLFTSKLADNTNKAMTHAVVHRASSMKRRPNVGHHRHYQGKASGSNKLGKSEEEIWSRVAQKLLESIVKKSLTFNQISITDENKFSRKCSTSSVFSYDFPHKSSNITKLLFREGSDISKIVSGVNIHHNCTHVNKHGVVIDTDDDFPPWLVKAMTCLMNWKEEPDEFPRFQDVFSEVNTHFSDLKEPLISADIGRLLRKTMCLLLLPDPGMLNLESDSTKSTSYYTATNDFHSMNTTFDSSKKTFENLMHNLKGQMATSHNMSCNVDDRFATGFFPNSSINHFSNRSGMHKSYRPPFCDEEEYKLIESAKLPIMDETKLSLETDEQKQQLIHDILLASVVELEDCCEDCLHKYNALNNFINKNAIEFNEFVSNLNYLDEGLKPDADSIIDPYEFDKHLKRFENSDLCHSNEIYSQIDEQCETAMKIKESQERFASLKLKFSPIKTEKPRLKNKILSKCISEKRLNRNNSFRTAMGEIDHGNEIKAEPSDQPANKIQKKIQERHDEFFKRPCDPNDSSLIAKSLSMNSIQGILVNKTDSFESKANDFLTNDKKRKLQQHSTYSLSDKCKNEPYNFSVSAQANSILYRNSSMNHDHTEKVSLKSLRSFSNDLCCSGGFENRNLNKYFSNSMNLENMSSLDSDKSLLKLSNLSINTLGGLLRQSSAPKIDVVHERRMYFNKVFSLSNEIESETLCFMIKAFRVCALMLPPTKKRKLHLLLRFLYKLKYDQHSCKYLLEANEPKATKKQASMESIIEDVRYIDDSLNAFSSDNSSFSLNKNSTSTKDTKSLKQSITSSSARAANRDLDTKCKAIEKIIIKSFFKSIFPIKKTTRRSLETSNMNDSLNLEFSKLEEEQLAMKLVQILINNYPEIMRIPDELITNVNHKLQMTRSSGSLQHIQNSSGSIEPKATQHASLSNKISLQQYDKQTADFSKQHLTELLNSILTDMHMKDEEKIIRLRKFKESHPDVYEEKYPTIKKALNILGLDDSASFLVPNIYLIQKNCFNSTENINTRRESDYYSLKKRNALAKLTESAKKKTGFPSSSNSYLNQTTIVPSSSASSIISSSIGFPKFFNKRKKENLI